MIISEGFPDDFRQEFPDDFRLKSPRKIQTNFQTVLDQNLDENRPRFHGIFLEKSSAFFKAISWHFSGRIARDFVKNSMTISWHFPRKCPDIFVEFFMKNCQKLSKIVMKSFMNDCHRSFVRKNYPYSNRMAPSGNITLIARKYYPYSGL